VCGGRSWTSNRRTTCVSGLTQAFDAFVTLRADDDYQKTYQDKIDVPSLFSHPSSKRMHIDRLFDEQLQSRDLLSPPLLPPDAEALEQEAMFLRQFGPDYNQDRKPSMPELGNLFEDSKEKLKLIKRNIEENRRRKRQRLNSSQSNQLEDNNNPCYLQHMDCFLKRIEHKEDLLNVFCASQRQVQEAFVAAVSKQKEEPDLIMRTVKVACDFVGGLLKREKAFEEVSQSSSLTVNRQLEQMGI